MFTLVSVDGLFQIGERSIIVRNEDDLHIRYVEIDQHNTTAYIELYDESQIHGVFDVDKKKWADYAYLGIELEEPPAVWKEEYFQVVDRMRAFLNLAHTIEI